MPGAAQEPPVVPDAPTARRWAVDELARPEYHVQRSLLGRLLDWLTEQFDRVQQGVQVDGRVAALVIAVAVLLALAVAWWVAGPVRRGSASASRAVLAEDDVRTAAQMRAAADAAAARGDWTLAVVERFRSVVRDLEERAVLDERPGRTAHEATLEAGTRLAGVATALDAGGRLFDDVAYGGRAATDRDDAALRELAAQVAAARRMAATRSSSAPAVPR
ncbi:DUF4129 domain-containing protein [Cellulomonas sp. DKR-3]|uniref:DUF4129 domain-containing protein n=1 Tax=Cellulomonas fulva TaxID=2835530 RepID=A0ABS5TZQ0_9CELL|nr:DUF4129 domain-containing protein [Cellulomonas fulva]